MKLRYINSKCTPLCYIFFSDFKEHLALLMVHGRHISGVRSVKSWQLNKWFFCHKIVYYCAYAWVLNLDESEYGITQRQFKSNCMSKGNNHPKYIPGTHKKQVENQLFNLTWAERILKILYSFRGTKYMNTCSKSLAHMIKSSTSTSEERGHS